MKITMTTPITDYEGNVEAADPNDKSQGDLTVRKLIMTALNSSAQGEVLTAEDKAKIYSLTVRCYATNEVSLTVDDLAFIKKRALTILTPLGAGRLIDILDPKGLDEADKTEPETTDPAPAEAKADPTVAA